MTHLNCTKQQEEMPYHPFRGGGRILPPATVIPEQHYESPASLFKFCYGTKFFDEIVESTNNHIKKHILFIPKIPTHSDINNTDLSTYFGLHILSSMYKGLRLSSEVFRRDIKPINGFNLYQNIVI